LAKHYFLEAHRADSMDHLIEYYLAVHYSHARDTTQAIQHIR
jgi:hypothetical protein